jgi:hypothetical protein
MMRPHSVAEVALGISEDRHYFAERERECRRLAAEATDPSARTAHLQLAAFYARRARPDGGRDDTEATAAG